jgi:hypothetical protein
MTIAQCIGKKANSFKVDNDNNAWEQGAEYKKTQVSQSKRDGNTEQIHVTNTGGKCVQMLQ